MGVCLIDSVTKNLDIENIYYGRPGVSLLDKALRDFIFLESKQLLRQIFIDLSVLKTTVRLNNSTNGFNIKSNIYRKICLSIESKY